VIRRIAMIARLGEFFTAFTAYASAYEALTSAPKTASRPIRSTHANDPLGALWTGVRAALAVFLVSGFWILANWAHGPTAAILGAVATTRLATMTPAVPIAVAATLIFSLSTIPAFIVIDVLLPLTQGFAAFAIAVAPMLFVCALLMAHKKTMLIGYFSALLFASAGEFQNQMTYARWVSSTPPSPPSLLRQLPWCCGPFSRRSHRKRRAGGLCARRTERSQGLWRRGRASASPSSKWR